MISLELGGAPADLHNLWPEPYTASLADGRPTGAHTKDSFETRLKNDVCAGSMTLAAARSAIGNHWVHAFYGIPFGPAPSSTVTPQVTPQVTVASTMPASSLTVAITALSPSVAHGAYATMSAHTEAGAACAPRVTYASGTVSSSTSLVVKAADSSGNVTWTWKVGTSTKPGTSTGRVTCTLGEDTATDSGSFQVT